MRIVSWLPGLLAGATLVLNASPARAQTAAAPALATLLQPEGPDPWVVRHGGDYYYTHTTGRNITLWKTRDLRAIGRAVPRVVWTPPATGPNSRDIWAPELHFLDGKWYLYYTATDQARPGDDTRAVFVLENAAPDPTTGTWIDRGRMNTRYAGLDGSVFEHGGQRYFLYSAYVGAQSVLALAPMQTPWQLYPDREVVLATPTHAWEKGGGRQILEGPEFLAGKQGQLYIAYSASACWDDNYSLGLLTAPRGADPLQPASWTKTTFPVFHSSAGNKVWGPGHNCFTTSADGREDWLVYHAKAAPNGQCAGRSSRLQRFTWNSDGTPNFGEPLPVPPLRPVPARQ